MIWIVTLLSLIVALADLRFYRRHIILLSCRMRVAFAIGAGITDLLPLLVAGLMSLLPDNTTGMMFFSLWVFFVYLLTVLPRLAFYFFHHFRLYKTGVTVAAAVVVLLFWGLFYGRTAIVVNEVEVRSTRLPVAFDGFRIAQFSDLHLGTMLSPERELQRIVDTINSFKPDLVVFTGDLVNIRYTELDEQAMRILRGIKAPMGVVSNLGNHDVGVYIRDTVALPEQENTARLIARQRVMGWRLPDNQTEFLVRDGDTITLTGISFEPEFREARHDRTLDIDLSGVYGDLPKQYYNITLSHLPQLWDQIRELGYGDLTLSGHVHAMQMSLNLGPLRISPARLIYKRWSGLYEENNKALYINDGVGYVGYPMRLGAYPELTLIILRR